MSYYEITCPKCGAVGSEEYFEMSLHDECYCPACGVEFLIDDEDEEEDDEPEAKREA